ncbi:MAG: ribokinase [Alphaproteobacteria bacterium]|nr:ribokinase [Alphaproteobacteria bacterium]
MLDRGLGTMQMHRMIINVGSINIDHVYRVPQMPAPGETLAATAYERFLGGKGVNQSIAIARADGSVRHVGAVGPDGDWALGEIDRFGVDTGDILRVEAPTGHAVIYVDAAGENQIVILGGANQAVDLDLFADLLAQAVAAAAAPVWVLLQNETNGVTDIVGHAKRAGCKVAYSAAPFLPERIIEVMDRIDLLAVNEIEAKALADSLGLDVSSLPIPEVLITRGADGAAFHSGGAIHEQPAFAVRAVDTTGAGDTFLGSFLAHHSNGAAPADSLRYAAAASALQVTRPGAAEAIPTRAEVIAFLNEREG